jgi:hypothetical protein
MKNLQDLVPNSNKVLFLEGGGGLTCLVHTAGIKFGHGTNYQSFATYIRNKNMYFLVVA